MFLETFYTHLLHTISVTEIPLYLTGSFPNVNLLEGRENPIKGS